jgi:hypothetical protein
MREYGGATLEALDEARSRPRLPLLRDLRTRGAAPVEVGAEVGGCGGGADMGVAVSRSERAASEDHSKRL